jgi:predicted RNase H-like HicB family nuclease
MKARITYWQEKDGKFLGFLNEYPDRWTQGEDLDDLRAHLRDLHQRFSSENIPGIRRFS